MPIATADVAFTNAQGAVMATSPASMPLHAIEMSGFPNLKCQKSIAVRAPAQAARFVFTATTEIRRSVAASGEPALSPPHPAHTPHAPPTPNPKECPGNARGGPAA